MLLSGCTSVDDPFLNASHAKTGGPTLSTSASKDTALASLPVAGGAASVRQAVQGDKAEQLIVYPNATTIPGENLLTVSVGGKARRAPSREMVMADMRKALPGVRMAINPAIGENAYGVFGYATGALPGGGSCLYAWQVTPQREKPSFSSDERAVAIRLRYCSTASSEEKIVGLMRGLRLKAIDTDTVSNLQMAAGTGIGDLEMFAAEIPASPRAVYRETPRVAAREQVPVVNAEVAAIEQPAEKPVAIANPVKVPMPADAVALTGSEAGKPPAEAVKNASQVPLPGMLIAATK
ncbi:hypothetical protein ASE37_03270 [Rhizobium sp. Root268]|nr:hypothetical protein ASC86_03270 [Rhizobium sp. Root1212]KRD38016.1 hypothetical protein ASE37_03270 [Rhizobium sp. Root268]